MEVCIRKESNGSIYIDREILGRKVLVQDEKGNVASAPMFSKEQLSEPPYNYSFVNVPYEDCVGDDFNDDLTFSEMKYNTRKSKEMAEQRIAELKQKLFDTDYRAIKFAEGELTEEEYAPYREERRAWRKEINSLGG